MTQMLEGKLLLTSRGDHLVGMVIFAKPDLPINTEEHVFHVSLECDEHDKTLFAGNIRVEPETYKQKIILNDGDGANLADADPNTWLSVIADDVGANVTLFSKEITSLMSAIACHLDRFYEGDEYSAAAKIGIAKLEKLLGPDHPRATYFRSVLEVLRSGNK